MSGYDLFGKHDYSNQLSGASLFSDSGTIYNDQVWSPPEQAQPETKGAAGIGDIFGAVGGGTAQAGGLGGVVSSGLSGAGLGASVAGLEGAGMSGAASAGWGAAGAVGSNLAGGGYSSGTGGMFTAIGSFWGPVGAGIGFVVDTAAGALMGGAAKGKAKKAANEYWQSAAVEMGQLSKYQSSVASETKARQGVSNVVLDYGTPAVYRKVQANEQKLQWNMEYLRHQKTYKQIRAGG